MNGERRRLRVLLGARSGRERERLTSILDGAEEITIVGTVSEPAGARRLSSDLVPDVVLWAMSPGESARAIQEAISATPMMPVVVLIDPSLSDIGTITPATGGWPYNLLLKNSSQKELSAALVAAAAGLIVIDPAVGSPMGARSPNSGVLGGPSPTGEHDRGRQGGHGEPLTPREREVLSMLAEGLPNKAIAVDLHISTHTVKFHIASIMQKLGASSRTEAVTLGIRRGLILL